ncbi:MAG: hypothetical protein DHS20C14_09520 [Phycisphaeraceae bacterium]|nr:MAG: hypothetical protein DHS20C14_09520 [Phycisphaeraceae bacterium]
MNAHEHNPPTLRIGPGAEPDGSSDPHGLLASARAEAQRRADDEQQGARIARRLFGAFIACLLIALICFVIVPELAGVYVPAWVPLLSFVAIAAGTILTMPEREPAEEEACGCDDGNPVGCCPGPRPLRSPQRGSE